MTIQICRSIISFAFNNPSYYLHKPHQSLSLSLLFFSTVKQNQPQNIVEVSDYLINKHHFSSESASKVASLHSHLKNPEKTDSVLAFLKENGFSQSHLEKALIKAPKVLAADLEKTIKPKFIFFKDLGFTNTDVIDILSSDPSIMFRSINNGIGPSIVVLKNLMGSIEDVSKLLKIYGFFLKIDLEKTFLPNFEILKSCGICTTRLVEFTYHFPRLFLHKPETMRKFVKKVDDLGIERSCMMFLHAVRTVGSMSEKSWEQKLILFRTLGLSENEILLLFKKKPQAFAVSERKIKEAVEVLQSSGKYDILDIFKYPDILICSVKNRLRPRLNVLEILEKKNLIKKWPSISTIVKMKELVFFQKFVSPYINDVGKVYMAK